jgi:metallo-beta-lactamase family protein
MAIEAFGPDARNVILFAGYQAGGTRGADLVKGAASIKIQGEYVPIGAEVRQIDNLSAHADASEIVDWLQRIETLPNMTFITHGEPDSAEGLRRRISEQLRWRCRVPEYRERASLV